MRRHSLQLTSAFVFLLTAIVCSAAHAQDTPPTAWGSAIDANSALAPSTPAWFGAWSPLRPIADIPRGLLRAPRTLGLLTASTPAIGAFILSGAPGALNRDFALASTRADSSLRHHGDVSLRYAREGGDYRRPLDAAESRVMAAEGFGWSPVGTRGMAIGRFTLDREQNDVSSFTARITPYVSSPIVATDSVTPPMLRARARLEGGLGFLVAGFGIGGTAALELRDHNSVNFPLKRAGRAASPAASFGVERVLPIASARVGIYRRWSEPNETNILNPSPLSTIYYPIQGFEEPPPLTIPFGTSQFLRIDRRATATGGTIDLTIAGNALVLSYETGTRAEDTYASPLAQIRSTTTWRASGHEVRAALQRQIHRHATITLVASDENVAGDARRPDLTGITYSGTDRRRALEGDFRVAFKERWHTGASVGVVQTQRTQQDFVSQQLANTTVNVPFFAAEVARQSARAQVAIGGSVAAQRGDGDIPTNAQSGPNFRRLIAPQLAYEVASARAVSGWVSAVIANPVIDVSVKIRAERTAALRAGEIPYQPPGQRNLFSFALGVVYR